MQTFPTQFDDQLNLNIPDPKLAYQIREETKFFTGFTLLMKCVLVAPIYLILI